MTEPSDAAKRKRDELAEQHWHSYRTLADATAVAFALYIDEVDRVARSIRACPLEMSAVDALESLMFPDLPDPDEELARAFHDAYETLAPEFGYSTRKDTRQFDPRSPNGKLMLATIKRLREQGRLTDAK